MHIRPRNWVAFQHYKDRNPPWIKLHKRLLDDYEFAQLPVEARALAPMLWLLASESEEGWIEANSERVAFRVRLPIGEVEDAIAALVEAGFFERDSAPLAARKQGAIPETETETETETENPTTTRARAPAKPRFQPPDWVDGEAWAAFVEMRQRTRHPLTERGKQLIVNELGRMRDAGQDVKAVLEQSVSRSWRGVFPVHGASGGADRWWDSEAGIMRKGAERNMKPRPGETMSSFRDRIKADIEKAGKSR